MRVVKNYLYNLTYQIFILIVPLATIPYISRVLGPKYVGINTLTYSVVQYFVLFAALGLAMYGQREIAYRRSDKEEMSRAFWEIELLSILTTAVTLVAYGIFLSFSKQYTMYYLCQSFFILACAADVSWFFIGLELFKITVLRNFVVKIASIICIFTLVKNESDLYIYIFIVSLAQLIGNLSLWPYLTKYIQLVKIRDLHIFQHFSPTFALFIPQVAINVYVYLNKIMLAKISSVESAAFFDDSDKIVRIALTVISALSTVMFPRIADAFSKGKYDEISSYVEKSFQISLALAFPMMAGLIAIAPVFVPWFFGNEFLAVIPVMMVEAIAIIPITCSQLMGMQYLVPTKLTKIYTKAIVIGAIINFVINIPLIFLWNAVGTAVATVFSEFFIAIFEFYYVFKKIKPSRAFEGILKLIVASLIMFVIVKVLTMLLPTNIITVFMEVLIGMVCYIAMLYFFKFQMLNSIVTSVVRKFRP